MASDNTWTGPTRLTSAYSGPSGPWPDDLDIRIWLRHSKDVSLYQKKFLGQGFQKFDRQTDRHDWTYYHAHSRAVKLTTKVSQQNVRIQPAIEPWSHVSLTESRWEDVADGTKDGNRTTHDRNRQLKTTVRVVFVVVVPVEVLHLDGLFNQHRAADVGRVARFHRSPTALYRFRWLRRLDDIIAGSGRYVDSTDPRRRATLWHAAAVAAVHARPSCVGPSTVVSNDVICQRRISHAWGFHSSRPWRHAAVTVAT